MIYTSTGSTSTTASLHEAASRVFAPDGGLYVPAQIKRLPKAFFNNIDAMNLREIAYVVANTLFGDDIPSDVLKDIVDDSFNFDMPLRHVSGKIYAIELFHGPSLGFKDVGARFMAHLLGYLHKTAGLKANVLVNTSGDTGGAVAAGFYNVPGIDVYVLYPLYKMTREQEAQFTTLGGNIHPLGANCDYDTCQELVREIFTDDEIQRRCRLLTANSINVTRLLPQTIYYFYAYSRMPRALRRNIVFSIPSGNLGNLTAGVIAMRMGLPVKRFVAAQGANHPLVDYLDRTAAAPSGKAISTLAPALDVTAPSNLPRLRHLFADDRAAMAARIKAVSVADAQISRTMREVHADASYLMDPHTAAATAALASTITPDETGIVLATAHPAKYHDTVLQATGINVPLPAQMAAAAAARRYGERIAPRFDELKRYLLRRASQ